MERYHIIKLGLAFTFYAAYCVRPMLVHSLQRDNAVDNNPDPGLEYFQFFQGVEGRPGTDFPVYSYIPKTSFSCKGIENGYYADLETGCQVFHICEDGRKISFLCPNGTIFQQAELICEWWNKVNCTNSPSLYEESAERLLNDVARRKASRRVGINNNHALNHGAVMRTEEKSSVRASKNSQLLPATQRPHIKNHRIPDNSDIEHQIEQAESNNRHLVNAQNFIQLSQKDLFGHQQQKLYDNHNYNNDQTTRARSRQSKKDIDKDTGNFLNTNYDQSEKRDSKKIQNQRNNQNSGDNSQDKIESLKEYHVQFASFKDEVSTTTKSFLSHSFRQGFSDKTSKTTDKFLINPTETVTKHNIIASTSTLSPTRKFAYGSTVKERFNSYGARPPQTASIISGNNNRGNVKFNIPKSDNIVTTYSPLAGKNQENFVLPPFPKHKSELVESENKGNLQGNQNQLSETPVDLEEMQIPEESSSFAKSGFNSISDRFKPSYANHRDSYSEVKELNTLQAPKKTPISSITPHLVTTQPINNGKPFVGSRVGTTWLPNRPTTQSKYTYLPTSTKPTVIFGVIRHSTTSKTPYSDFNSGNTDNTLPVIETSTPVTNSLPTDLFNVGRTDTTLKVNIVPDFISTTMVPQKVFIPQQGSLNLAQNSEPVNEPPFIKKTVPLLYQSSTEKTVDQATVYGSYPSSTPRVYGSIRNTLYSPTIPTVTKSSLSGERTLNTYNNAVPIKFSQGQDKISIHLSKNIGSSTRPSNLNNLKVGTVFRVADNNAPKESTFSPERGFFVTKSAYDGPVKSKIEKPRPFSKFGDKDTTNQDGLSTAFPSYHISSARPFTATDATKPTPVSNQLPTNFDVYNNIDNMIGILQEIANFNTEKEKIGQGLTIPPSVSPQTLHSLAQYFASELGNNETHSDLKEDKEDKLTTLLTAMTVHGYNNLFNTGSSANNSVELETTTVSVVSKISDEATTVAPEPENPTDNTKDSDGDLLSTTSLPELRQLARNFSLALSSYLNDPDNFRKNLESLRPTEPPPLDSSDIVESSTTEDELLNFSDADIRPSTPAVPSPTWGYILASEERKGGAQEEVKNSLTPDLHTADSQSFVPRFNHVLQSDEKRGGFTILPPNHWTSSTHATKLWQKALSVNPSLVNENLETTTIPSISSEQTTASELFNADVLPDLVEPISEITYDLRELPPLSLNSTQVHGILIDFMNHTKSDGDNRLNRILKKLNTSEEEFLSRMKEIESNPLTKRLILLLISECGANITQDLGISASNHQQNVLTNDSKLDFGARIDSRNLKPTRNVENHALGQLVDPYISEDQQDTRALQLLNSLYTIASRFGRKR
ncbi:mucin-6-like [Euwallacea fornicatus]|uniref:mucin-6-like n=1 Tax=Euwallacea fornicatus TaxID=995702 RepID=UPI00338FC4C6